MAQTGLCPAESGVDAEDVHVVYGGSLQIPFCVGSVAIPLSGDADTIARRGAATASAHPSSPQEKPEEQQQQQQQTAARGRRGRPAGKRAAPAIAPTRCTHRRYCYLRDGSELEEDCFYRWLSRERPQQQQQQQHATGAGEAGPRPKRARSECSTSATLNESGAPVSPSLLYAFLECVEFIAPSSFAQPRRVLRTPPFIIEDDTWAEHSIEIRMHFLPFLGIPPVTVLHQVLLQQRVTGLPLGLLSKAHGLPKPDAMVLVPSGHSAEARSGGARVGSESDADAGGDGRQGLGQAGWRALCAAVTVSERQDALRILHPTFGVLRRFRAALALGADTALDKLRETFTRDVLGVVETSPLSPPPPQQQQQPCAPDTAGAVSRARAPVITTHEPALAYEALPVLYQRAACDTAGRVPGLVGGVTATDEQRDFLLPAEACIFDYVQTRSGRCLSTLRGALMDLEEEQAELCDGIVRVLRQLHTTADELQRSVDGLHEACLAKLAAAP